MSANLEALAKLKQACDQAYDMHPHSYSHAVWQVIQQYLSKQPWMDANALMAHVQGQKHWKMVAVSEIGRWAREGELVIGGKTESSNGHVIVVYPGPDKPAGGYAYTKDNKQQSLRTRGNYAPALSTSLGSWPGAMSKGDKTVWDPWANDAKFGQVTFWKLELKPQQP